MILPHASDYLVTAMVYKGPDNSYHRTVLLRRESPGRCDRYMLIQERSDDGVESSLSRNLVERDITEDLYRMATSASVPIFSKYLFFRLVEGLTVGELADLAKTDANLREDLELIFGTSFRNLQRMIEWKP